MRAVVDKQLIEIIVELHATFNDFEKVYWWLTTPNLNIGGMAPLNLIRIGKGHKILQFIEDVRAGDLP